MSSVNFVPSDPMMRNFATMVFSFLFKGGGGALHCAPVVVSFKCIFFVEMADARKEIGILLHDASASVCFLGQHELVVLLLIIKRDTPDAIRLGQFQQIFLHDIFLSEGVGRGPLKYEDVYFTKGWGLARKIESKPR